MRPQVEAIESGARRDGVAARGMLWLLAQAASGRAALFLGQIVLARLLSPRDFGSIGLTYTITTIIGFITASGIADVLLQRSRTFHLWAWPSFWIDLALASIGAVLVAALAPLGARLYAAPEITGLALVLAVSMPLSALSTIPLTALRVALNFRSLAAVSTAEVAATQALSVLFAWFGMGAYSFVVPMPIVAGGKAIWLWALARPRFSRTRPRRAWLYLVRSGSFVWSYGLFHGLMSQGDCFVLGLLASREEVGLYFFALRLSAQPLRLLAVNLYGVLFPVLAQLRSRAEEQSRVALKAFQALAAAVFFAACLQVALVPPVLHLLFRNRWDGSIPLSQVLSIGLAFDAVSWVALALINARAEFKKTLVFVLFSTPYFFSLVGFGAWLGRAPGVAIAVALYFATVAPCYCYIALRSSVGAIGILRLYLVPLMLAGAAVVAAYALANFLLDRDLPALQIGSILVFATSFYAALLRLCMPETFSALRAQVVSVLSSLRR
jgi:O-antigen/teichoic acid export membrane protein